MINTLLARRCERVLRAVGEITDARHMSAHVNSRASGSVAARQTKLEADPKAATVPLAEMNPKGQPFPF